MEDKIKEAIEELAKNAKESKTACDAQQYSQAAVNLSNVIIGLDNLK